MLMHIFNVGVGMTFSGGFIDLFLFGILQGNAKTNWIWVVIVGIVYFVFYYFLFTFLIRRLDLKTPGREISDEVKLYHRSDVEKNVVGGKRKAAVLKRLGVMKSPREFAKALAVRKIFRMWTAALPDCGVPCISRPK